MELCEVLWVCGRRRDDCSSTPLHGDVNSQFTTPDAKEQIWANPWHDLMVNFWRPVLWVSESSCPIHARVSAGGVWAVMVTCDIPVRADFFASMHCDVVLYFTCFCILYFTFSQTKLQSSLSLGTVLCPWVRGVLVHEVVQGRAKGGAGRGISSPSCCSALVLAQLLASSQLSVLQLAEPLSLCSTKGNILLAPLEFESLLPF